MATRSSEPAALCRAPQGSGPPLATHPNDGAPDPAGRIVFGKLSYANEMGQVVAPLFAIDPDGSDLVQILDYDVERPRISRDGTRLAFTIVMSDGSWQLATSPIDGSDIRILTSTPPGEQTEKTGTPDWAPDGTWLVYANNHTLWRIDADGSNARLIGDPDGFDWEPRFSPDGKSVVFLHGDFVKGVSEPWIHDLATGEQRPVSAGNNRELEHPDWSPDGRWIIYNTLGEGESIERMPSDDPEATPEELHGSGARPDRRRRDLPHLVPGRRRRGSGRSRLRHVHRHPAGAAPRRRRLHAPADDISSRKRGLAAPHFAANVH